MNHWCEHPTGLKYTTVEVALLEGDKKEIFFRRREAVLMRLDGCSLKEIADSTGVPGPEVSRLIKRFKTKSDDGICFGEAILIPRQRIKRYERTKPLPSKKSEQKGGMAGAMGMLLRSHPAIEAKFVVRVFGLDTPVGKGTRYVKQVLCQDFYTICTQEGVGENEWPFTQQRAANRTICTLIDSILEGKFFRGAMALGGRTSLIHSVTGHGVEPLLVGNDVLDVLEIDSQYQDGLFVLNVKGDRRLTTTDIIDRFWLISARCRRTKAVFASKYVFGSQVTALDIFQVICEAFLGEWQPKERFSFDDLEYNVGAGMPAYIYPELKYHCIAAIYLDNAMQHYANDVQELCSDVLGIAIDYGPLNLPSRRNTIEGLFKALSHRVLHTLSSTTGSNPFNGRSDDAAGAAVYYNINIDEALEVLDCYIANFNATPMSGANKSNSPLEAIASYLECNDLFIPVIPETLVNLKGVGLLTRRVKVQGNLAKGVRPRIKLDRALYTSPELSESPQLIGNYVYVKINPADFRVVKVYLESGIEFGELLVEAAWRDYKHSVQVRKIINRAHDKKAFRIMSGQSPIAAYRAHLLNNRTPSNNRALIQLDQEMDREAPKVENKGGGSAHHTGPEAQPTLKKIAHSESDRETNADELEQRPKWEAMNEFDF